MEILNTKMFLSGDCDFTSEFRSKTYLFEIFFIPLPTPMQAKT